jgi:chromosome segregation ATPase
VSARAAATRRESPLSNSSADAESDARAETVAALDDLKERLANAETSAEHYRKQSEVSQSRLEDALKEQATLEEKQHETDEQIEALRNEKREAARLMREMEAIYEAERSSMTKEKEEMGNREEEMQTVIQRLKDSLAQRNTDDEIRPSRQGEPHGLHRCLSPPIYRMPS